VKIVWRMPEAFGRYRLLEQLGEGGMASVWRAVIDGPEGFARTVVVKRILPVLSKDARFVQMFLAEARLCALLHHPSIVQVNDLGEVGGEYFLAMEYVEGADLASILKHAHEKGKKLPPGLCCYILLALAEGLAYAHALRDAEGRALDIVHRDISPSNIMLTSVGGVKLLDFGIAKAARHVREEQTRTGTLKGKISYMSPEQADGQKIDRRSDLFALGVVFWECLTGERLFKGEDELETLRMVREAKIWPPSSVRPEIEPDIDAVALRMLAKSADLRYPTGDELAAALQPIVHRHHADAAGVRRFLAELGPTRVKAPNSGEPTTAGKRTTPSSKLEVQFGGTITRTQGELSPVVTPPPRSMRGVAGLVAGAAVAALLVGAYLLRGLKPTTPPLTPVAAAPKPTVPAPAPVAPAPAPAPIPVAPAPPAKVHLSLSGPAGATVSLDGKSAGALPLELDVERRDGMRALVVERTGYATFSKELRADEGQTLKVSLKKKSAPRSTVTDEGLKDFPAN
jgi:serine/threonine-protein kinase